MMVHYPNRHTKGISGYEAETIEQLYVAESLTTYDVFPDPYEKPKMPLAPYYMLHSGSSVEADEADEHLLQLERNYQLATLYLSESQAALENYPDLNEDLEIIEIKELMHHNKIELAREKVKESVNKFPESQRLKRMHFVLQPPGIISNKLPPRKSSEKEIEWLKENSADYRGNWVALYDDQLIACHKELSIVLKEAKKQYPLKDILVHFIPN